MLQLTGNPFVKKNNSLLKRCTDLKSLSIVLHLFQDFWICREIEEVLKEILLQGSRLVSFLLSNTFETFVY